MLGPMFTFKESALLSQTEGSLQRRPSLPKSGVNWAMEIKNCWGRRKGQQIPFPFHLFKSFFLQGTAPEEIAELQKCSWWEAKCSFLGLWWQGQAPAAQSILTIFQNPTCSFTVLCTHFCILESRRLCKMPPFIRQDNTLILTYMFLFHLPSVF